MEKEDVNCPKCGKPMKYGSGEFGMMLACSDYPNCKFITPIGYKKRLARGKRIDNSVLCPGCGRPMTEKTSNMRSVISCSECKLTIQVFAVKPDGLLVTCGECGRPMSKVRTKYSNFLGCTGYPKCKGSAPVELTEKVQKKCPVCRRILTRRKTDKGQAYWGCSGYPDCRYTEKWSRLVKRRDKSGT